MPSKQSTEDAPERQWQHAQETVSRVCSNSKGKKRKGGGCSSSSSECFSLEQYPEPASPPPLDGGYGWVIVITAFLTYFIADGISSSFGILYVELLTHFKASKSITSLIGSIFYGTALIGGPLASALVTKFGCRKVLMFGGVVAAISSLVSAFSDSIELMCLLFGITGLGIAMAYVTVIVMVSGYFEKKRAFATGLAVCGSGCGIFAFAPLTKLLVNYYGWRGTMIIRSGVLLNFVVLGILLRPLQFTPAQRKQLSLQKFERMSRSVSNLMKRFRGNESTKSIETGTSFGFNTKRYYSQIQIPTFLTVQNMDIPVKRVTNLKNTYKPLAEHIPNYTDETTCITKQSIVQDEEESCPCDIKENATVLHSEKEQVQILHTHYDSTNPKGRLNQPDNTVDNVKPDASCKESIKAKQVRVNPDWLLHKDDLFCENWMSHSILQRKTNSCPQLYRSRFEDDESQTSNRTKDRRWKCLRFLKLTKHIMKSLVDPSILVHRLYVIFAISNFLQYFCHDVPYIFLIDRAEEIGIDKTQASFLISILGVSNTLGQLMNGIIGDRNVNRSEWYGVSLSLSGLSCMLMPLFSTFGPLAVLCGTFELFVSVNYALGSVILVEYLGLERLPNAYGTTMLIQGVASLIGPPVTGALYDSTGTYDATFYMAGASIAVSGLMLLVVPCAQRCSTSKPDQEQSIDVKPAGPQQYGACNVEQREANCAQDQPQTTLLVKTNGGSFA